MNEFPFLILYLLAAYFCTRFIVKRTMSFTPLKRVAVVSFIYALFFGIGFAGTGGEPGFALPAPNLMAIILMLSIGFYDGVISGLYLLFFWWLLIFIIMYIKHRIKKTESTESSS